MNSPLEDLDRLHWLVAARNEIQSLMLRLRDRWQVSDPTARVAALAVAFSLWRAVFLLVDKHSNYPMEKVDDAALRFLEKIIRTNAITFNDDMQSQSWSSGYYVKTAIYQLKELTGREIAYSGSPSYTVRETWNEAFRLLSEVVEGTFSGTESADPPRVD
jgi:hypothetical protein